MRELLDTITVISRTNGREYTHVISRVDGQLACGCYLFKRDGECFVLSKWKEDNFDGIYVEAIDKYDFQIYSQEIAASTYARLKRFRLVSKI